MISVTTVLKNVPFSNNEDIFEASTFFQEGLEQTLQGVGILTEAVRYSEIRKEEALKKARNNFSTVTCLADYLVKEHGITFEESHQIVGYMVGEVTDKGYGLDEMNEVLLMQMSEKVLGKEIRINDEVISKILDPVYNVQQKASAGSPNPLFVKQMLEDLDTGLKEQKKWLAAAKKKVENSYSKLASEEARIMN